MITISDEAIEILRHIIRARKDNATTKEEICKMESIRDIIEYALADNIECLRQFDYLPTLEEKLWE